MINEPSPKRMSFLYNLMLLLSVLSLLNRIPMLVKLVAQALMSRRKQTETGVQKHSCWRAMMNQSLNMSPSQGKASLSHLEFFLNQIQLKVLAHFSRDCSKNKLLTFQ